jgi:hypothetical protein
MKQSFLDHIENVAPALQTDLMCKENFGSLTDLSSLFPADVSRDFGFETRLTASQGICDFFLQIRKNTEGALIMARESAITSLSDKLLEIPFWGKIEKLFKSWNQTGGILAPAIETFWLEFDYLQGSYNLIPNIFFGLIETGETDREEVWKSLLQMLNEIYQCLFDLPFPRVLVENLKLCLYNLPVNARLYQVGLMVPRKLEAVRLVLVKIGNSELEKYLKKIGWPGEFEEISRLQDRYCHGFDYLVYNLNIAEDIHPFLGIEMYGRILPQPLVNDAWNGYLDFLRSEKQITREKIEALNNYCVKKTVNYFYQINYISGINHLKLVYKKNFLPDFKGYFGTMIRTAEYINKPIV